MRPCKRGPSDTIRVTCVQVVCSIVFVCTPSPPRILTKTSFGELERKVLHFGELKRKVLHHPVVYSNIYLIQGRNLSAPQIIRRTTTPLTISAHDNMVRNFSSGEGIVTYMICPCCKLDATRAVHLETHMQPMHRLSSTHKQSQDMLAAAVSVGSTGV